MNIPKKRSKPKFNLLCVFPRLRHKSSTRSLNLKGEELSNSSSSDSKSISPKQLTEETRSLLRFRHPLHLYKGQRVPSCMIDVTSNVTLLGMIPPSVSPP